MLFSAAGYRSGFLAGGTCALSALAAVCAVFIAGCTRSASKVSRGPDGVMDGAEEVRIDRGRPRGCLLLHGFGGSPADFRGLYDALDEAGWDVRAPRLPGHGTRPQDLAGVSRGQMTEAARRHYAQMRQQYDTVALVGFSMGGCIATGLAVSHPPDALALVSPFFGVTYRWYHVLPAEWWYSIMPPVLDSVPSRESVNRPAGTESIVSYGRFPMPALGMLFKLKDRVLRETRDARLAFPVLLVYSADDGTASPEKMKEVLGRLTEGDYRTRRFTRSDHYILHDYDRHEAVEAIVDFLTDAARKDD